MRHAFGYTCKECGAFVDATRVGLEEFPDPAWQALREHYASERHDVILKGSDYREVPLPEPALAHPLEDDPEPQLISGRRPAKVGWMGLLPGEEP